MPIITVKYATSRAAAGLKAAIAQAASDLAANVLHKDPKVTAVVVEAVEPADWFAGGHSLAELGLSSFWLDIRITDGTNSKDEKAAFVAAVFKRMGELLGPLHTESYVHANEVRADAYGYGGQTQERRYIAGKLGTKLSAAA
jgi:4-oxalocrotonate tautomerase